MRLELHARTDSRGRKFHVAKLRAPISLDATNGISFLIFTSESGEEELQIAPFSVKEKDPLE